MDKLVGILFFVAFIAGIAFYVRKSYSGLTPTGMAAHYGLPPGEIIRAMWIGELDIDISTADRVGTAALGLIAGALVGGVGIASARAPGVTALLTSHNRLMLVCEGPGGTVRSVAFASPAEVRIRHLGPGARRVQGGPSAAFEFCGSDGVPLRVLLHESAVPELARWSGYAG
jgi:hypothetical protein